MCACDNLNCVHVCFSNYTDTLPASPPRLMVWITLIVWEQWDLKLWSSRTSLSTLQAPPRGATPVAESFTLRKLMTTCWKWWACGQRQLWVNGFSVGSLHWSVVAIATTSNNTIQCNGANWFMYTSLADPVLTVPNTFLVFLLPLLFPAFPSLLPLSAPSHPLCSSGCTPPRGSWWKAGPGKGVENHHISVIAHTDWWRWVAMEHMHSNMCTPNTCTYATQICTPNSCMYTHTHIDMCTPWHMQTCTYIRTHKHTHLHMCISNMHTELSCHLEFLLSLSLTLLSQRPACWSHLWSVSSERTKSPWCGRRPGVTQGQWDPLSMGPFAPLMRWSNSPLRNWQWKSMKSTRMISQGQPNVVSGPSGYGAGGCDIRRWEYVELSSVL